MTTVATNLVTQRADVERKRVPYLIYPQLVFVVFDRTNLFIKVLHLPFWNDTIICDYGVRQWRKRMARLMRTIAKQLFSTKEVHKQVSVPVRVAPRPVRTAKNPIVNTSEDKTVKKDDYLLNQIDEFREKAQQLQDLLLSKFPVQRWR